MDRRARRALAGLAALGAGLALAACSDAGTAGTASPAATSPTAAGDGHAHTHADGAGSSLPGEHVHGVAIDPADGRVHLATHEGLYRFGDDGWARVGPVVDLMGFTSAGPGHFYASGHPGPGVDLPNPVGLIESTDAGETWRPVSRQGQSDFHAMTASRSGVLAFDGAALQATDDGSTWRPLDVPVPPFALDVSPDGRTVVVTSRSGPVRSADGGASWDRLADAPLLQVVDWADDATVVGVTPDGVVELSEDAGATWTEVARLDAPPQAVAALRDADGALRVVVVTTTAVVESVDLRVGFVPLGEA